MTEAEFQNKVIEVARMYGWKVMHTRPAQMQSGRWATPIQGDAGFPDLVLARPRDGDLIFAELKATKGRVSIAQAAWLKTITMTRMAEAHLWYPDDLPKIIKRLARTNP